MIKKFICIPIIFYFLINYVNAEERSMNELLKDGFKIIKEERFEGTKGVFAGSKIFTLKKREEIRICSTRILKDGSLESGGCLTP